MKTLEEQLRERPVNEEKVRALTAQMRQRARAAKLRELREELNVTQVGLAEELHVSQKRVSQIEHGDIEKTQVDTLRRYVEALGGKLEIGITFGDNRYVLA